MRTHVAALLLLAALTADAQWVSPVEHVYGTTTGDYVLAAGRNGAVLAWDETDAVTGRMNVEVARADATGQLLDTRELEGDRPSVASDGEVFLLAFTRGSDLTVVPVGDGSKPARVLGTRYVVPSIVRTRDGFAVWTDEERVKLDRDGNAFERVPEEVFSKIAANDQTLLF
jgi:hypothetical protein